MYVCPANHRVRPPGQYGRSWCPECEDYLVPEIGSPVLIGSTEPKPTKPVPAVRATIYTDGTHEIVRL